MKYLKLFEEMEIEKGEFPFKLHDISPRERIILTELVGDFIKKFIIRIDDYYYYVNYGGYYNRFENFKELKDYLLSWYCINTNKPEEYIELLKTSKIDPSFDCNWPIWWASQSGHTEVVKHLLNDPRVDPSAGENWAILWASCGGHKEVVKLLLNDKRVRDKLTEEEINRYTNEIS